MRSTFHCLLVLALACVPSLPAAACCASLEWPAGSLWDGLQRLAARSGESIHVVGGTAALEGRQSPAVRGDYTLPQALDAMLRNSGMRWSRDAQGSIVVQPLAITHADVGVLHIDAAPLDAAQTRDDTAHDTALHRAGSALDRVPAAWLGMPPLPRLDQVLRRAPNVVGSGEALSIRGIERGATASAASSVYLDGIPLGGELLDGRLPLPPLAGVSYLRGSVSGRDAYGGLAGAIRIDSADPPADRSTALGTEWGPGGLVRTSLDAEGALPIDGLSARVHAASVREPGDVTNAVTGERGIDDVSQSLLHARAFWEPDAYPEWTLRGSALFVDGDPGHATLLPSRGAAAFDPFSRRSFDPTPRSQHRRAYGASLASTFRRDAHAIDLHAAFSDTDSTRRATLSQLFDERSIAERNEGFSLLGAHWQHGADTGWVVGAGIERARRDDVLGERTLTPLQAFFPAGMPIVVTPDTRRSIGASDIVRARRDTVTFDLAHRFERIELGARLRRLREVRDQRRAVAVTLDRAPCTIRIGASERDCAVEFPAFTSEAAIPSGEHLWVPEARVAWHRSPESTVSLEWRRGYLAGGARRETGSGQLLPFLAERSDTFEAGWRDSWLDGRLSTRVTVFRNQWKDRQVALDQRQDDAYLIVNAGRSHASGGEAELRWQGSRLGGWLGVGWLRTRFDVFSVPGIGGGRDLAGKEFAEAPRATATLGAQAGLSERWTLHANLWHSAAVFSDSANTAAGRRPAYTLLDLRLAQRVDDALEWWLFADNALDAEVLEDVRMSGLGGVPDAYRVGPARTLGAGLRWSW